MLYIYEYNSFILDKINRYSDYRLLYISIGHYPNYTLSRVCVLHAQ